MTKVTNRVFNLNYYEKEGNIWSVVSHLEDGDHDITMTVEVDMTQMQITDACIRFERYPLTHCPLIEEKAKQLKGLKIGPDFVRNAMKIFMGPQGCPNIMTLLNTALPGIRYFYYPYKVKTGEITADQWNTIVTTELKNDCLAHTML